MDLFLEDFRLFGDTTLITYTSNRSPKNKENHRFTKRQKEKWVEPI